MISNASLDELEDMLMDDPEDILLNDGGLLDDSMPLADTNLGQEDHLLKLFQSDSMPRPIVRTITPSDGPNNCTRRDVAMGMDVEKEELPTQQTPATLLGDSPSSSLAEIAIPEEKPLVHAVPHLSNQDLMGMAPEDEDATKRPPKRHRHRRAVTETCFDFLQAQYEQERQKATLFGPEDPPKRDPLNAMAHSFLKEEQSRLTQAMSQKGYASSHANHPTSMLVSAPVTPPVPAPAPTLTSASSAAVSMTNAPVPPLVAASNNNPATSTDSDPSMMVTTPVLDQLMAQASEPSPNAVLGAPPPYEPASHCSPADQPQPSRLSQFLDQLQAQADRQGAMIQQQNLQQQQNRQQQQRRRHRRVVSEGPNPFVFQPTHFDMSDRVEDQVLFGNNNHPPEPFRF